MSVLEDYRTAVDLYNQYCDARETDDDFKEAQALGAYLTEWSSGTRTKAMLYHLIEVAEYFQVPASVIVEVFQLDEWTEPMGDKHEEHVDIEGFQEWLRKIGEDFQW